MPQALKPASTPVWRRHPDLAVTLAGLLLLLAWDATGWDIPAARAWGTPTGFPWHEAFVTSRLMHDGGRLLAWVVLAGLLLSAARALGSPARTVIPGAGERGRWIAVTLVCLLAVPALKHFSLTSCPSDLAMFGGVAQYVSHWRPGVGDGGSGHCFPSGHAVAAFAFFSAYFLWRGHDPRRARWWLAGVLGCGTLFGLAQLARGAHYPSHTMWSAWICWTICAAADALMSRSRGGAAPRS